MLGLFKKKRELSDNSEAAEDPKVTIEGYVYQQSSDLGLFEDCQVGDIVAKPDRKPPWIVVSHSFDDVIAPRWPLCIWRVEVIDPLQPQGHKGNYTRCFAVRVLERVESSQLFGEHGESVELVLQTASDLDLPMAHLLAKSRSEEVGNLYSRGWVRWMEEQGIPNHHGTEDFIGVLRVSSRPKGSPIGSATSLIHQCVFDSAEREEGKTAFEESDDGVWLKQPWSDATQVLLEAAFALGAPHIFDKEERYMLLNGWASAKGLHG